MEASSSFFQPLGPGRRGREGRKAERCTSPRGLGGEHAVQDPYSEPTPVLMVVDRMAIKTRALKTMAIKTTTTAAPPPPLARPRRRLGLLAWGLSSVTLALLAGAMGATTPARAEANPHGGGGAEQTEVIKPSTKEQLALSDHLRRSGILFYGAWWCPACFKQKTLFGKEAISRLPYVECDKEDRGRQRCIDAQVKAFPTWVKGSSRLVGVQSLDELKRWSGFPASP